MHIKNIWKKGIAFGLSAVLAAGSITPVQAAQVTDGSSKAAEEKAETATMLAHYPLQSDVDDVSGNNKNAEIHGSVSWDDGLVLPGGKKTSAGDASYVTLPEGLFDGKDEVTISAWIKSNTDKGNYSALFFGTKAQNNNMPLNYWLFNPTNPSGNFKSVFTNDNNSGAPYQTEVGISSTATTANKGVWTHYTTVLTEDSVTGYINGKKIGTTAKTKKTSDFGTGLQAYIGRSNYLGDNTYAGSFQDLRIYDDALDAQEVEDVYLTADSVNDSIKTVMVDQIADKLSLDEYLENGILCKDGQIELPEDFYGAAVTWTSDQPEVISATGKVTLPSEQTVVKLEAEVKLGTASAKRNFQITVLAKDGQIDYWKEHLQIPYVLDAKTVLPVTLGAVQVDWTQDGMIAADGSVKADFEGKKKVTLEAVLDDGTKQETLEIPAYILGKDAVYAETYTRTPDGDYADKLAYSMHLAYSENGESDFAALNDNSGILYMRASENENETLTAKSMKDPYLFYTKEGGFAVAAVRTESNGATDGQKASSVMIYKTENLLSYEEVGFLDLKTEKNVQDPVCEYDALADVYRITWNDGEGNFYQNTVKDLSTESSVSDPETVSDTQIRQAETGIAGAKEGNLVALENAVGTKLKTKLSKLVNTGVEVPEKITASFAADIKNVRATAYYNDGSTASKAVNWDLSDVDFKTGGTYTVNGTVTQPTFHNENYLFYKRPDPEMVKYNGKFYFISTDENGQGKIYIRVSDTLKDIGSSEETLLLSESTYTDLFTACLWAPELHVIGDDLYLFFTGSKSNWAGVQSFVAKLKEGGDPIKTADWEKTVRVLDKDGNNLYEPEVGITLDMTYFEVDGQGYVVWAQRKRSPVDLGSWLYIATVDSTAPWKLTSDRVCISKPDYGWDNNTTFVDEGPFVIQRDGNIFMTFSGAGVNPSYCVGILTAKEGSNLLDASSWTKGNYPILTSRSVAGQYGPGHNSYIYDDDGTLYNVYHAQWNKGARSASIRRVHFDIDGMPVLDLVEERDLLDEYKNVTMQVEVKASEEPQPETELLAHYPLQNDAKDITENHNDGTVNGTVTWSDGLVLPGEKKTSDASASYVTLPEGMLDQQDEVTISAWIKSNTDKGNYSALFFGTAAQSSNSMPLNYWLFNPTNPSGLFKSVFTDNNNSGAPYQTEAGVVAGDTTAYKGIWTHYTTVIAKDSITGYINGKKIGTTEKTKTTSDFGSGLQAYIGRSNYLGDNTYAGSFQDLRIYNGALNTKEVQEIYADTDYVNASIKEQLNSEITSLITLEDVLPQGMITEEGTISLPQKVGDYTIRWSSSDPQIVSADGKVTLPENSQTVILTATVEVNGKTVEKKLKVFVKGKKSQGRYLLVYNNSKERTDLGLSLHLGYSEDGTSYTALNSNTGICFAKNSGSAKNNNKNVLVSPYIFRRKDGGFGMIAANSNSGSVYVFDSEDLIRFTGERTLKISDGASVQDPTCEYDEEKDTYVIRWKNGTVSYQNESADLKTCTQAQAVTGEEMVLPTENIPDGAAVLQVFEVTEEEYTKVVNKLGVVTNTGVEKVERTLEAGSEVDTETLLPKTVTLNYSDGSTQDMNVTWDKQQLADLSTDKAGTYTVTGTVQQIQYENPFIEQRADPCILKGNDGYYYFTASYPMLGSSDKNGYDKVVLRRAKTIEGLKDAEEVTIWDCDDTTGMYRYIWAPEIRLIAGSYYIYYTASTQANSVWGIRPHVLKCTNPEDIMNPASWEEKGRFQAAEGDTKAFTAFSLDMTYFENNGHHYAIWAQTDECSCLFMAEIDPEEPWKCISQSVRLSYPEYSWERVQENVNEGPSVLKKNGKIYVAYSASGTGSEYTMGLLSADENADLLDVNVWTKQAYPALTSADVPGEYGPGHNSFTVDENGNDIFVYHARSEKCYLRQCAWANQGSLYDPCRDARLKRVHYAADGTPILKMTYAQELADEFKTVTAQVTVKAKEEPKPDPDPNPNPNPDPEPDTEKPNPSETEKPAPSETEKPAPSAQEVQQIVLSAKNIKMGLKEKVTLKATLLPEGTSSKVTFKSSKKSVVKVSKKGVLTAKRTGKAVITVTTENGKTAKCRVTVKKKPTKVTIKAGRTTLKKGQKVRLKTKLSKGSASYKLTFKSSKKSVASVSANGVVTAKKKGTAAITVKTYNGKKAKVKITVK